jgi:gliding motility-associated-like protein
MYKRVPRFILSLYLILVSVAHLFAEGSKDITATGGYRAYLYSSTAANASYPFPTLGTMKVYVKAGESIYVGSSAQGLASGTINLRAPDGTTYTSGTGTAAGLISTRTQEIAGPLPNANGYTPFIKTVAAGQDGVWEIDFVSPDNGAVSNFNPTPILAGGSWAQPNAEYVVAFDVTVRNAANTAFLTGRVFTNVFSGILGAFNVGFNGVFYVLTKDGYQYTLDNNGQAGNGFTFFVNNKGFRDANGAPTYKSVDGASTNVDVQDPRAADTQTDVTHKIFFNSPAADLPTSANTPGGSTTWLLNTPVIPVISNVTFIGTEGTLGKGGTNPLGGNFTFTTTGTGTYSIMIDVNQNGVLTDPIDRKLTGIVSAGTNHIYWDGLDGLGNKVPAGPASYNTGITIATTAGEVHFPFFDVERNVNGIILNRLNGIYAPNDTVYWDDSPINVVGTPSNPKTNLTGIRSITNGHKWGTNTNDPNNDQDFGNNKSIDTWGYIKSRPVLNTVNLVLQQADLSVDKITAVSGCAGAPVVYTVTVSNKGPSDVIGAKFSFTFPNDISGLTVNSVASTGASAVSNPVSNANVYTTNIDMANGAVRTFTITGNVAITSSGNLTVSAAILRPSDVTDPDATNPDAAAPTDAAAECNALPSGVGCNNIQTNTVVIPPSPYAGADQTVFEYTNATLNGTGSGTWSQATSDANLATIVNPSTNNTAITNLNNTGLYHFVFTNANGCSDTVVLKVILELDIPNIITPNNDGKNDVFKIVGLESYPGSSIIIFNRWGNEVYKSDNYQNNWDGDGLPDGTYYYVLTLRDHAGNVTSHKGWVFLKRTN